MLTPTDISTIADQIAARLSIYSARWLKVSDAASYAGMSRNTLFDCIANGEIKAKKRPKGGWIVDRMSIDEYNSSGSDDALFADFAKRTRI